MSEHEHSPVDFVQWGRPVHRWVSPEAFLSRPEHRSGLHSIAHAGGTIDLGFNGDPLGSGRPSAIPVFFLGLTKDRDGALGPYFSGLNISAEIGTSSIMVADPVISDHGDLTLAWYAGCAEFEATAAMHRLLKGIAERYDVDLLLVGGSGGGFAALSAAHAIGPRAQVFCWNPQSDVLRYVPETISPYLRSAYPASAIADLDPAVDDDRETIRDYFDERGIKTVVGDVDDTSSVLLLQNGSDWHVRAHFRPYVERRGLTLLPDLPAYHRGSAVAAIGSWGQGHVSPPRDVTVRAVQLMLSGRTAEETMRDLAGEFGAFFPDRPELRSGQPR